jgi:hypothetical protein
MNFKIQAHFIEMVRRQWSGNAHAVISGIGVVTCVYVYRRHGMDRHQRSF